MADASRRQRENPPNVLGQSRSSPRRDVERAALIGHGLYAVHGANEAYCYPHQVGTTGSCLPFLT